MAEEGDNNNGQRLSAPESSCVLPQLPSLWYHDTAVLSPFMGGHEQQAETCIHDQDFFNMLPNVEILSSAPLPPPPPPPQLSSMMLPNIESGCGFLKGESSGTKRITDVGQVSHPQNEVSTREVERVEKEEELVEEERPPKTRRRRSSQVHNLSERTRRSRINEKIRTLKELIPNCNKADKVSVLSDAIEYIKVLQQRVQTNHMYQSIPVPYHSSYFSTRLMTGMGYEMGLCYNSAYAGFPMIQFPQGQNPIGESGIFLPSPSQLHFPSVESVHNIISQQNIETTITASLSMVTTTMTPSTSITSLSSTFSQGESSSAQSLHCIDADLHQAQI